MHGDGLARVVDPERAAGRAVTGTVHWFRCSSWVDKVLKRYGPALAFPARRRLQAGQEERRQAAAGYGKDRGVIRFPESVKSALRDGRLVVFAGAGVSMGEPARLPGFESLARTIARGTGESRKENEPVDRFLGRLKHKGTKVHELAAKALSREDLAPTTLHRDLLRLYSDASRLRIVTTNFDLLFEQAAADLFDTAPDALRAPALPLGHDFNGIVHVHGAVSQPQDTVLTSLWRKSRIRPGPGAVEFRTLNGMAMGKRPAARQASPMWVDTADLPTNDGHPYFERLNRVLADSGFDAFVEELCAAFYADRLGRPSLRPGRYFRMLFIGYFEGLSSERGIAWRVADSLSLRSFLDLELTEAAPDHSTLSRTRRRIDVETHEAVFTWILERLSAAGLVRGKTVGIDATTLEANAAMRSIERRDTGESHEAFIRRLAEASGVETPTRADLARFDRSRKNKKTSNKEWKSPQDPDAKVAKMKDGRTHMAHKAEHGVDMDTGAIVSVTVQDASDGDTATLPATLIMAAEQVELVQPDGPGVEEVVADKGYHSDETLVALGAVGVRSHVSEPERGRRCWQDKKTGETPPEKRAAQKALYANRRRVRGRRGRRLQRCRGEVVERTFAHMYETGGMRRVWVRGHENVRKRVLLQAAACNIGLLLRSQTGIGTPRSLQGRAVSAICRLIGRLIDRWGCLTRAWGSKWTPATLAGSIAHRQAA